MQDSHGRMYFRDKYPKAAQGFNRRVALASAQGFLAT
jgi:hypothetical protein